MSFPEELTHYEEGDLQLDPTRLLVGFAETVDREEAAELLEERGLRLEEGEGQADEDGEFPASPTGTTEAINHGQGRFWARSSEPIDDDTIEELADSDDVEWVSPAYQRQDIPGIDGILAPVSNALLVEYDEQVDEDTGRALRASRPRRSTTRPAWPAWAGTARFTQSCSGVPPTPTSRWASTTRRPRRGSTCST